MYALIALGYTMVYGIIESSTSPMATSSMVGSFVTLWLVATLGVQARSRPGPASGPAGRHVRVRHDVMGLVGV